MHEFRVRGKSTVALFSVCDPVQGVAEKNCLILHKENFAFEEYSLVMWCAFYFSGFVQYYVRCDDSIPNPFKYVSFFGFHSFHFLDETRETDRQAGGQRQRQTDRQRQRKRQRQGRRE